MPRPIASSEEKRHRCIFLQRVGMPKSFNLLVEFGADVNAKVKAYGIFGREETSLHSAAKGEHAEVVRLLVEFGTDVNAESDGFIGGGKIILK